MKSLGRNRFDNVKEHYDSFTEDEQKQVLQLVITYLGHYGRFMHALEKDISVSLYNTLLDKWEEAIQLEKKILDEVFVQYFPNLSSKGISALTKEYKAYFDFKVRRLKLLNAKRLVFESKTHQLACIIKKREDVIHSRSKNDTTKDVPRLEMDEQEIVQADIVYPTRKKDDSIILIDEDIQDTVVLSGDITALDMDPPTILEVQVTLGDQPGNQLKEVSEPTTEQLEKPQSPPVIEITQNESTEEAITQKIEDTIEKNIERAIIKSISPEPAKQELLDDDDEDSLSISGPIDMTTLSASEMMKIANVMQSHAHKKRLKEQRIEAETIQNAVEILSGLLPETSVAHLPTPISKLGQLVADASDQIKSLEDASQISPEKSHKKAYGDKLAKHIENSKIALSHNGSLLKKAIESGGKYLASTSNITFFYSDISKNQVETEQEIERLCKTYVPLQDSIHAFNRSIDELHDRLNMNDNERAKRFQSLRELKSQLTSQVDILQRAYSSVEAIFATLETYTLDLMEEFYSKLLSTSEYMDNILESWKNALSQMKQNFNNIFTRIANA